LLPIDWCRNIRNDNALVLPANSPTIHCCGQPILRGGDKSCPHKIRLSGRESLRAKWIGAVVRRYFVSLPASQVFLREDYVVASTSGRGRCVAQLWRQRRTGGLGECLMRKSRLAALTAGVSLLIAGLLAPPSSAAAKPESVTINLTAVVDLVDNPNGVPVGTIAPGDVITGSYTYNPKRKI
jgi:hypothetical protein